MVPELGQVALVLALILAVVQSVAPLWGSYTGNRVLMSLAKPAVTGQLVFAAVAFGALTYAFVTHDFSVAFVAGHSNSELPMFYRFGAVWGGHEGSLLLWILVLAIWSVLVAVFSRQMPERFVARVLGVLGVVAVGFLSFTLFTSNPFDRLIPAPVDGQDLNPILQDPALMFHPPLLYIGYVGFAVAFAFAIAALLEGRIDAAWARWTRPWTTAAWLFLTLGISLGSWWAYYELGWGGWWFWDPVENASFLPWLVGTALIHSLAVTEKRGLFKSWTLLLAISAFSLSLLGTFLVRSGILVSVHAFAADPSRGMYILAFMGIVVTVALALYAWRAPSMASDAGFKPLSRETFLLANNILLVIATLLILLGTLYPLFMDALNLGKISVGPPYFDLAFMIPMFPLMLLIGIGLHTMWRQTPSTPVWRKLRIPALAALVIGIPMPLFFYGTAGALTVLGSILAFWVMITAVIDLLPRVGPARLTRSHIGMCVAHFGLGVLILGVTFVSSYDLEVDRAGIPGQPVDLAGYEFTLLGTRGVQGPNFDAIEAEIEVSRDGEFVTTLYPQKRVYRVQRDPITQTAIGGGWRRELLVSMGEPLGDGAWSLRIQYKPLVRYIWLGTIFMALGGVIAISDRRYRLARRRETEPATTGSAPAAAGGQG
ncbi:MAG: heme lyase CcmF/NrfE family subunit [Gammaproteobacteria bacterium]|nr:MAG: heme lyase CcmF/NrfE family subunit [Gammaproteobacteria bacterium]